MYICIYIYLCIDIHIHDVYIYNHMYICRYVYKYIHRYVHRCMYIYIDGHPRKDRQEVPMIYPSTITSWSVGPQWRTSRELSASAIGKFQMLSGSFDLQVGFIVSLVELTMMTHDHDELHQNILIQDTKSRCHIWVNPKPQTCRMG